MKHRPHGRKHSPFAVADWRKQARQAQPDNHSLSNTSVGADISDQVLLRVDMHRTGTGNAALIPLGTIERVEIVRGPSSVLYGGVAMGGVINVITRRGRGDAHGTAGVEYGSNNSKLVKGRVSGGLQDDRWRYTVAGDYKPAQDYRDGHGDVYGSTDKESIAGGGSLTFRPSGTQSLTMVGSRHAAYDNGSPDSESYPTPHDRVGNSYNYASLEYDGKPGDGLALKGSLYGAKHWYEYEDNALSDYSTYDTATGGGRIQASLPVFGLGRLTGGTEYTRIREGHGGAVYAPDASYDLVGVFAEHKIDAGQLTFLNGLRYDY